MNRDGIRDFAADELGLVTSKYRFAESRDEAIAAAAEVGLPCVVKPVMSSSGKGQSTAKTAEDVGAAWDYAVANMRGDRPRVIVEEFIDFDSEITLAHRRDQGRYPVLPARSAIARRRGDYRESWQPAAIPREALHSARYQARKVVEALGGHGIFGVEFFVCGDQAIFSELSPRPHDTGMVTLISQFPNEFELHLRAILGLPIPSIELAGPSASAVILASRGERQLLLRRRCRSAGAGRAGLSGRPQDLRQAQDPRRTAAWALRLPAAPTSKTRSLAPRLQPLASAFVIRVEGEANAPPALPIALAAALLLGCLQRDGVAAVERSRRSESSRDEQKQLHQLDAFNLAIGLKRAIYDAGYTCKRVTDAGFVGTYKNLDMWMAHCDYEHGTPRDWAIFAGPDGSAQVRDCKDIPGTGLPGLRDQATAQGQL